MSDLDEIKSRLNIVDLVGARIQLKKAGRNFKALCPFHNEKTPSFIVSPDRQTFHCFGCGKGGSVFDWVMEYEHVDFSEALETLAEMAGVKLERKFDDSPQNKIKTKIYEANHLASEYYQYLLTSHSLGEKARQYLKNRGISDKTIKTFGLGYSPNSWDGLKKFLHKKGYDDQLLETAGLIIRSQSGGYDRFRGRVMFTLRDHRGNVVGFSGRVLDPEVKGLSAGRQEAKYINTSETPVYIKGNVLYGLDVTKGAIQKAGYAILMEGEFDMISSFQEGVSNAVAIKGSALTEGHINLLKRFTNSLIFALDADVAGDSAARRGINLAEKSGFDMKVARFSQGKDPDEAVRENPTAFKKAITEAIPIYDYFIQSSVSKNDKRTALGKKNISNDIIPVLVEIDNPVVQAHYIKIVAGILDVSEQIITDSMKRYHVPMTLGREAKIEKPENNLSPLERLELYILALVLQTKTRDYFEELKEQFNLADFTQNAIRRILELLDKYFSDNRTFLVKDFSDSIPAELLPILDQAYLWDLSDIVNDDELTAREWLKTTHEFRRHSIKKKIRDLSGQLQVNDQNQENSGADGIKAAILQLTQELRTLEKSTIV